MFKFSMVNMTMLVQNCQKQTYPGWTWQCWSWINRYKKKKKYPGSPQGWWSWIDINRFLRVHLTRTAVSAVMKHWPCWSVQFLIFNKCFHCHCRIKEIRYCCEWEGSDSLWHIAVFISTKSPYSLLFSYINLTGGCWVESKQGLMRTGTSCVSLHFVCSAKGSRSSLRASSFLALAGK